MLKGVKCVLGYVDMEKHQTCMVTQPGPPCLIEPSILEMMTRPNAEREEGGVVFSPSSLSSCQRQAVLTRDNDWYLDVRQGYKMVRGTIIHAGMGQELAYPGVIGVVRELRMGAPINTKGGGRRFHGKPDLVVLNSLEKRARPAVPVGVVDTEPKSVLHVKIVDYKTRSTVGHDLVAPDRDHVYQINMYAWLVQKFLPGWLNSMETGIPPLDGTGQFDFEPHLFLNKNWPITLTQVDEVVVDELSITYMDMVKTRTFTSRGFLYDKGKMLSDKVNGRWVRRFPVEHEELELEPIHQFKPKTIETIIRKGIEKQEASLVTMAEPLTGAEAEKKCPNCSVRQICYDLGRREGYGMEDQIRYVKVNTDTDTDVD